MTDCMKPTEQPLRAVEVCPIDRERVRPALDAVLAGDATGLQAALDSDPGIVDLRICDDTMLELAAQPGAGPVSLEIIDMLAEAGAELDRALNLAACWNRTDLCARLLALGADPTARTDANITPLESAAMHSSTEAADLLIEHGLHRNTLWLAAATGLLPAVQDRVAADGSLVGDQGPYRPNWADVGRPPGDPPSDDPIEIVGEAFVFAALNNRRVVVDYLLDSGVDINVRPYRNTTALHFAIQFRRLDMVRHLIERGASVTVKDGNHRSDALGWARACDDGSETAASIRELVTDTHPRGSEHASDAS